MNVVHRDLKLGNLVLDRRNHKVTITNFCLGKHLASENERLQDQRGSPAYISPDVLCGKPYLGTFNPETLLNCNLKRSMNSM